jgi:2-polyprenyl-3-methyl-5-hydroxy-6-metoxy-1,4-benzoquinol methylase
VEAGDPCLEFEKEYFRGRNYEGKEKIVKRNVVEVLKWASKVSSVDFSLGRGKRALDVGCAYGYVSEILTGLGYETCSVDLSKWGINKAKALSGGNFLVCDAQTMLPFRTDSFDLVTCFDVLEHLQFPEKALRNMLDSCKGSLICTTPNRRVEKTVRRVTRDYDETHVSVKSPSEWENAVKAVGDYKLVKVETFYDVTAKLANSSVLFKSFKVPAIGLTVRILVTK